MELYTRILEHMTYLEEVTIMHLLVLTQIKKD